MIDTVLAEQMRRDGATYQEIANHFGCTRQAVHLHLKNHGLICRRNEQIFGSCPYEGLRNFCMANKSLKITSLSSAIFGTRNEPAKSKTQRLVDGCDVSMTINNIKNLEKFTGMTFDELFCDDSSKDEPNKIIRDQWICATERLPELTWKEEAEDGVLNRWGVSEDVLVFAQDDDGGEYIVTGWYEDDSPIWGEKHTMWVFDTFTVIPDSAEVTHWMPLPNPPAVELVDLSALVTKTNTL